MYNFTFYMPTTVLFGPGKLNELHEQALPGKKAAENPAIPLVSSKDFVKALDNLISELELNDLKMSEEGITEQELESYPAKVHQVLGGDISADPLPLSDEDYLTIFKAAYK